MLEELFAHEKGVLIHHVKLFGFRSGKWKIKLMYQVRNEVDCTLRMSQKRAEINQNINWINKG